jgi:hypothetical protein
MGQVARVVKRSVERWTTLDSDWQGVLVGTAILVLLGVPGPAVP